MPIVAPEFLLTLTKEADLVRQFVTLLEKEQTILTEGDTEELPALAIHKEQLAETLNELARQRNEFLSSAGFQPGRAG